MKKAKNSKRIAAIGVAGALALAGGAVAANASGVIGGNGKDAADAPDQAITGPALDKASAAALQKIGQGKITGTEAGGENSAYQVEVTKDDGTKVDVQLDKAFAVVATKSEGHEGSGDKADSKDGSGADKADAADSGADKPDAAGAGADKADAAGAGTESGAEGADDATDTTPDANPNEPGHQDAGE